MIEIVVAISLWYLGSGLLLVMFAVMDPGGLWWNAYAYGVFTDDAEWTDDVWPSMTAWQKIAFVAFVLAVSILRWPNALLRGIASAFGDDRK